ncbi:hypothetical protein LNKW23_26190 [Paralimibaculum aggregatum]|uniref:Uncharacterized protein n=1 Tax=Paralimibaculum aggregatum TaxID=3036245 RepID=A0ABQ6LR13_9RHOB|nr:hypothetical protein [Limibaculum sp. NKW23]GMG83406.1 hypothetical protein LNKW23_26190 [Limibaculum sp. NKW23]
MNGTLRLLAVALVIGAGAVWYLYENGGPAEDAAAPPPEGPAALAAGETVRLCLPAGTGAEARAMLVLEAYTPPATGDGSIAVQWPGAAAPQYVAVFPATAFSVAEGAEPKRFLLGPPPETAGAGPLCAEVSVGDGSTAQADAGAPAARLRIEIVEE